MTREAVDEVWDDWQGGVNMRPADLEKWLDTEESRSVGQKSDGGESTGHASGRRIVELLRTRKDELTDGDIELSAWRYSLMNWGHDPLR